jgi:hypothetical protein
MYLAVLLVACNRIWSPRATLVSMALLKVIV